MSWKMFGKDEDNYLILCFDGHFEDGFYVGFNRQLEHNNKLYISLLQDYDEKNYKVYTNYSRCYVKNENYNLEDCIKDFIIYKKRRVFDKFPIYILKNDYWYIIEDEEFILKPTGVLLNQLSKKW